MGLFGTNIGPDIKIGGGDNGLLGQVGEGIQRPFKEIGKYLSGESDPFNAPPPSEELQGKLQGYQQKMLTNPYTLMNERMGGVNKAPGDLGFDPTSQALSGRAQRAFQKNAGSLPRQAELSSKIDVINRMGQAQDYNQKLLNFKRGIDERSAQLQMQAEATRNQVLGGLFGSIASAAGTYAGMKAGNSPNIPNPASQSAAWASAPPLGTGIASAPSYGLGGNYSF